MDFDLSSEQSMLAETATRWARDHYGALAQYQGAARQPAGFPAAQWGELGELGLLGLPWSEDEGGIGGGPVETMVVAEAFGRTLMPAPWLASVILAGGVLRAAATPEQRATLAPGLIDGSARLAFAHGERQSRYDLTDVATTARRDGDGDGWVLDGAKTAVWSGGGASHFLISARSAGSRRDRDGLSLFVVEADRPGLSVREVATHDGGRDAELVLDGVRVGDATRIGAPGEAFAAIEQGFDVAVAALCANAVGAMAALHEMTLDYLKTRKQFGVAIGSFQSLQHAAVDMLTALEQSRSMSYYAAMMASHENAGERAAAISAAKVQINRAARQIGEQAVQLHGGIGMTEEYLGAHYFRHLALLEFRLGDTDWHLRRLDAQGGLIGGLVKAA